MVERCGNGRRIERHPEVDGVRGVRAELHPFVTARAGKRVALELQQRMARRAHVDRTDLDGRRIQVRDMQLVGEDGLLVGTERER